MNLSASKIVIELFSGVAVGLLLGYYLDLYFQTKALFIILCTIFGFVAGFFNIYKSTLHMNSTQYTQAQKAQNKLKDE